jgi:ribosome-binding protein aMBF1 (putative translation factor)
MATCNLCGREFANAHGVEVHKSRLHKTKATKATKTTRKYTKRPLKREPRKMDVVLNEKWADGNGRILLTDQDGNWWVAKKLSV